ncbi:hypothetical protein D3C81_1455670 [compost metagenome]
MPEHVRIVVRGQQRIDRDRHHSRQQAAEEHRGEIDGIERAQQQPLFLPEPRIAQRAGKAAGAGIEFGVGQRSGVVDIGDLGAPSCIEVARKQVFGGVVARRQHRDGAGIGGRGSIGGRHVSTPWCRMPRAA